MPLIAAETPPAAADPPSVPRKGWFFNPYFQMSLSIVLTAGSHVFLKRGSGSIDSDAWFGFEGLKSIWVWYGIFAMVASLLSWLYALRFVALNIAFNLAAILHALVPLCGWIFFHEKIGVQRGLGIALVVAGVFVIAKAAYEAEEKL